MLNSKILLSINDLKPESVDQLIEHVSGKYDMPKKNVIESIIELENQGKIRISQSIDLIPENVLDYLFTENARWFWLINIASIVTVISVYMLRQPPLNYLRQFFGFIYILFIPGFSFMKTFFPEKIMGNFERITLSIGLSITLTPLVGMLLNYTPWGLTVFTVTASLLGLTILLSLIGIVREHNYLRNKGDHFT